MPLVKETGPMDFPKILPLLKEFQNPNISEGDWTNMFNSDWRKEQLPIGFHLEVRRNVEGFVGGIYSKRLINGRIVNLCNLTSWIVREEYRNHSLSLLLEMLKIQDHTFTNLTPIPEVCRISRLLGFSVLENRFRVILPSVGMFNVFQPRGSVSLTGDFDFIKSQLSGELLRLLNDHAGTKVYPLLVMDGNEKCLAFYKIVIRRKRIRASHFVSASNFSLFNAQIHKIMRWIFFRHAALFSIIDERFVTEGHLKKFKSREMPSPKLFKSDNLKPAEVDYLYSEYVLL